MKAAFTRDKVQPCGMAAPPSCGDPLAAKRARQLFKAGKDTWGTDEDVFIEIVGFSDAAQAAALRYEYAMRYGHTLGSAVKDEMSGELEALLLAFLHPPPGPPPAPPLPTVARPGMVLFPHAILMDNPAVLAMSLGLTVVITESGAESLDRMRPEYLVCAKPLGAGGDTLYQPLI